MTSNMISGLLRLPVSAHQEYAQSESEVVDLFESLEVGDILRTSSYHTPLKVIQQDGSTGIIVSRNPHPNTGENKRFNLRLPKRSGTKYPLYLEPGNGSQKGVSDIGIISRADRKNLEYTFADLDSIEGKGTMFRITFDGRTKQFQPNTQQRLRPHSEQQPQLKTVYVTTLEWHTQNNTQSYPPGVVYMREGQVGNRYCTTIDAIAEVASMSTGHTTNETDLQHGDQITMPIVTVEGEFEYLRGAVDRETRAPRNALFGVDLANAIRDSDEVYLHGENLAYVCSDDLELVGAVLAIRQTKGLVDVGQQGNRSLSESW